MCLSQARLINPEKEITCYKLCKETETLTGDKCYVSPYMGYIYELGKLATNGGKYAQGYVDTDGTLLVTRNAFHTFKTLKGAQSVKKKQLPNCVIVKCIIPKESTFVYEGVYNFFSRYVSYASQQLLPISVVES